MKFLVENALSVDGARGRSKAGFYAIHFRDIAFNAAADPEIFDRAAAEDRIVISADTDFRGLLALRGETRPSIVLFRGATPRRPTDQVVFLLANLPKVERDLRAGAIVILEPTRIRVRSLPITDSP